MFKNGFSSNSQEGAFRLNNHCLKQKDDLQEAHYLVNLSQLIELQLEKYLWNERNGV